MSRKIQLTLLSSSKMTEGRENGVIRLPRRARNHFGFDNNIVVIGKGEHRFSLEAKKAYKIDVQRLAKKLGSGGLTEEEVLCTGFVSRAVLQKINRRDGESIWISDEVEEITVGADPEFALVDETGRLVRGNRVLVKAGAFGSDGPAVEVRPDPSVDHRKMVDNITNILKEAPAAAAPYGWKGGATFSDANRQYWFGGHIHLGRPHQVDAEQAHACYAQISTVLDHLVGFPLVKFDTPDPEFRRQGCPYGYGMAGTGATGGSEASIRTNPDRFEYRVLSGLWLTHPTLAKIVVGVTKAVAESAYVKIAAKGFDYDWVRQPLSGQEGLLKSFGLPTREKSQQILGVINRSDGSGVTQERLTRWKRQIADLERFDDYAEELKALRVLVEASAASIRKNLVLDLREGWLNGKPLLHAMSNAKVHNALEAVADK